MTLKEEENLLVMAGAVEEITSRLQRQQSAYAANPGLMFRLPVTLGSTQVRVENDKRFAQMAQDSAGGFANIMSLTQHAANSGQYPTGAAFIGYGVLQEIAQNGMIRACVSTVADDMTREWIEIKGGKNSDKQVIERLQDLQESKYHLRQVFHEAALLTGFEGGALIYIDTMRGTEEKNAKTYPLAINEKSAELTRTDNGVAPSLRFTPIDPVNVTPGLYNCTDPLRPDYMKPHEWYVMGQQIHGSRLLPCIDNPPPTLLKPSYNFFGIPQAQILWDYVMHWNKVRVYAGELLKKISLLVVQTDTSNIMSSARNLRAFDVRMKALSAYRDLNSIFVCDKNEEGVTNVQTSISGATDIVRQSLENVAAINRTPAVKLLGISPSGFNATGESDIRNYYDYVRSKQELWRENILTCLKAIQVKEFGRIDPSITFEFNELGKEDEAAAATVANAKSAALATLLQNGVIDAMEARTAIRKDPALGLEGIDTEAEDTPMPPEMTGSGSPSDDWVKTAAEAFKSDLHEAA